MIKAWIARARQKKMGKKWICKDGVYSIMGVICQMYHEQVKPIRQDREALAWRGTRGENGRMVTDDTIGDENVCDLS